MLKATNQSCYFTLVGSVSSTVCQSLALDPPSTVKQQLSKWDHLHLDRPNHWPCDLEFQSSAPMVKTWGPGPSGGMKCGDIMAPAKGDTEIDLEPKTRTWCKTEGDYPGGILVIRIWGFLKMAGTPESSFINIF